MIKLYNKDCISGMEKLADNSVDLILTDLPYNLTDANCDKQVIDLPSLWAQFKRILKPYSSAVLFASGIFSYKLISSNPEWYKYKWIWVKNAPTMFIHAKNAPMRKFEEILVFSDGSINHASVSKRRMKYNPQGISSCRKICSEDGKYTPSQIRQDLNNHGERWRKAKELGYYIQDTTGYPSDVLNFDVVPPGKKKHMFQKPVPLLEFLIKTYTDQGGTVLDATMGSGSTGVACVNLGRNFIGYELDEKYFDEACHRINKAINDTAQCLFDMEQLS